MSRRLEKLIEQKAWETLTDYGYNDAHLLEQLTESVLDRLDEQVGAPILPSWTGIVQFIQVQMAQANAGQGQDSYAASTYDYDGDGQIGFGDLTIALSLWARGIMPVSAQDYQAGALIIDDSGLGEPIPPEGEELLNVLTGGQNSLGFNNPVDAIFDPFRNQTGAQTNVYNPFPPEPPAPPPLFNRSVSRTPGDGFGFAPQVPGYGQRDGLRTAGGYPVRPPSGPGMGGGPF